MEPAQHHQHYTCPYCWNHYAVRLGHRCHNHPENDRPPRTPTRSHLFNQDHDQ